MYTSYIGKKFLSIYNKKKRLSLSAEEFFNTHIFPLFFNDEKHFLNVANSSFFQPISKEDKASGKSIHKIKLDRFHKNVKEEGASLTTLVGYSSQDVYAGTSGQTTSMTINIDEEEIYSSWIGSGLSIAMGGGYSILVDKDEVLYKLFRGWEFYRRYLNQTSVLKGNQIDVWNSYWIVHALSTEFSDANPLESFNLPEYTPCKAEKWKKLGFYELSSNNWSKIVFGLSKAFPSNRMTVNAFKFADMNQTLGFINIYLPEVHKMYELRDAIFMKETDTMLSDREIEQLSTFYNFKGACQLGTIGLKSLEPSKLREFMPRGSMPYAQGKEFKFSNEESFINYQLYKIWITAMLNKTELLNMASDVASALIELEKSDERGKKVFATLSQEVRDSKTLKEFIDKLTSVLEHRFSDAEIYRKVVEQVLKMPSDNFPLFVTLIRFEYNYQKAKN